MAFIYCHNCGHKIQVSAVKHRAIGFCIAAFGVIGWFTFLFAGSGHAFLIAAGITVFGIIWMANAKSAAKEEAIRERCPFCGSKSLYDYQRDNLTETLPKKADPSFEERIKMLDETLSKHFTPSSTYTPSPPSPTRTSVRSSGYTQRPSRIAIGAYYSEYDDCPRCSGTLVKRYSEHGAFLGCSNFPRCRFTFDKPESCPRCGSGELKKRSGRKGYFLGCSRYPNCHYTREL